MGQEYKDYLIIVYQVYSKVVIGYSSSSATELRQQSEMLWPKTVTLVVRRIRIRVRYDRTRPICFFEASKYFLGEYSRTYSYFCRPAAPAFAGCRLRRPSRLRATRLPAPVGFTQQMPERPWCIPRYQSVGSRHSNTNLLCFST